MGNNCHCCTWPIPAGAPTPSSLRIAAKDYSPSENLSLCPYIHTLVPRLNGQCKVSHDFGNNFAQKQCTWTLTHNLDFRLCFLQSQATNTSTMSFGEVGQMKAASSSITYTFFGGHQVSKQVFWSFTEQLPLLLDMEFALSGNLQSSTHFLPKSKKDAESSGGVFSGQLCEFHLHYERRNSCQLSD